MPHRNDWDVCSVKQEKQEAQDAPLRHAWRDLSGVVLKNEVGERLEIEVETVAKSAILQEFCIVWALLFLKL